GDPLLVDSVLGAAYSPDARTYRAACALFPERAGCWAVPREGKPETWRSSSVSSRPTRRLIAALVASGCSQTTHSRSQAVRSSLDVTISSPSRLKTAFSVSAPPVVMGAHGPRRLAQRRPSLAGIRPAATGVSGPCEHKYPRP